MPDTPIVLVTGASSGIGAATARAAAAAGSRVALAARSRERLEALAADLGGPDWALALPTDVTEWPQQQAMVAAALTAVGRLDVVCADAGVGARRGFLEESPEHWRQMILTNVYGAALTVRAAAEELRRIRGHPLLTGSVAGSPGRWRATGSSPGSIYSCTTWAITALAEAARQGLHGCGCGSRSSRRAPSRPRSTTSPPRACGIPRMSCAR